MITVKVCGIKYQADHRLCIFLGDQFPQITRTVHCGGSYWYSIKEGNREKMYAGRVARYLLENGIVAELNEETT